MRPTWFGLSLELARREGAHGGRAGEWTGATIPFGWEGGAARMRSSELLDIRPAAAIPNEMSVEMCCRRLRALCRCCSFPCLFPSVRRPPFAHRTNHPTWPFHLRICPVSEHTAFSPPIRPHEQQVLTRFNLIRNSMITIKHQDHDKSQVRPSTL